MAKLLVSAQLPVWPGGFRAPRLRTTNLCNGRGERRHGVSTSIIIEQPIRDVFAFAANPGRWAEWITGVSAVEEASGRYRDVGSTFEQTERASGYHRRSSWQVIEYQPPHVSSCRRITEPPGIVRQVFESVEGSTRLNLRTEADPGWPFTSETEVERAIGTQQKYDLGKLKRLLERVEEP